MFGPDSLPKFQTRAQNLDQIASEDSNRPSSSSLARAKRTRLISISDEPLRFLIYLRRVCDRTLRSRCGKEKRPYGNPKPDFGRVLVWTRKWIQVGRRIFDLMHVCTLRLSDEQTDPKISIVASAGIHRLPVWKLPVFRDCVASMWNLARPALFMPMSNNDNATFWSRAISTDNAWLN